MDLYFQGMGFWNKGMTPEYMTKARDFFERALALDPRNIEALVGMASIEVANGRQSFDRRWDRAFGGG